MKLKTLMLLLPIFVSACATAPSDPLPPVPCPKPPALSPLPKDVLGHSFTLRIRDFLSGNLPELNNADFSLPSVALPMIDSDSKPKPVP